MLAAFLALAGVFVALYLTLYKLGYIGTLACSVGSCETVQTSRWATLFGVPVGAWGVGYYVVVLAVCLIGLTPSFAEQRGISLMLVVMTSIGVVFSAWLTYLELFVINAICQWCVISALLATALCVVSWLDLRDVTRWQESVAAAAAAALRGTGYGSAIRDTGEMGRVAVEPPDGSR